MMRILFFIRCEALVQTCYYFRNILLFRDSWGRVWSQVVAIDAIFFRDPFDQYRMEMIDRELNKAFMGFSSKEDTDPHRQCPIVSGHWGCGAFNGNRQLKGKCS